MWMHRSGTIEQRHARASSVTDIYFAGLGILLTGYAIFGKSFAYIGAPPLYIGEIALLSGLCLFLTGRLSLGAFADRTHLLLGLLMLWGVVCTIPFIGEYGVDALRDSVIINYGIFSFIVTSLLLQNPDRITLIMKFLRTMTTILVPLSPLLFLLSDDASSSWELGVGSIFFTKPGLTTVHLGGAALLALFGFRRAGVAWLSVLCVSICIGASQNRGGALALTVMLLFAAVASNRTRQLAGLLAITFVVLAIGYALDLTIPTNRARDISVAQVVNNFISIVGDGNADQGGTKMWRLEWWHSIIDYTINGPYFWSGKGFGINLALSDGFMASGDKSLVAALRSPHSCHLTILARTGVVGSTLWAATMISWSATLLHRILEARQRGDSDWLCFFVLALCYGLGLIIDASFDVALEGPMSGIWFWCIIGAGIGGSMIYGAINSGAVQDRIKFGSPDSDQPASGNGS
jgi:hypothetical protein